MDRVSIDDLFLAAQWLDVYEGAEDRAACQRVARMLGKMIAEREQRAVLDKAVKEMAEKYPGMSEATIRQKLRAKLKETST